MKFTPHPTTSIEPKSSEANLCSDLQSKNASVTLWPEAHLELNGTEFLWTEILFSLLPIAPPSGYSSLSSHANFRVFL